MCVQGFSIHQEVNIGPVAVLLREQFYMRERRFCLRYCRK